MLGQKRILIIIGIIILVAIIVGGAFYIMQKSQTPTTNIQSNSEIQNQTQIQEETADWKTYKSNEYGFEFKYPEKVTVQQNGNVVTVYDARPDWGVFDWNMKFYKNNSKEELKTWINSQFNLFSQPSNKDCKIVPSDKYGLKVNIKNSYTVLIDAPSYEASCAQVGYYTISPNSITIMEFDSVQASPELYQDILTTFKFTK